MLSPSCPICENLRPFCIHKSYPLPKMYEIEKQISEKLNLALTTVDYNVKKLAEVGLITVHHKKWSQKGKKVNYYAPAEKFILIAPKASTAQIFKVLKTLIPILAIIGLFIGILGGMFLQKPAESTSGQRFLSESEFSQEKAAQPQAVETTTAGGVGANVGLTVGNYTNNTTITADVVK